ncbi:hypothetical protein [Acinetobacter indicus]|uniref:hypothetical protein n=1 Tax=Acinetobacter indicus TaxID=756892 RepID=UPI0013151556|nr:hypothetical protein [Acinetobacter indicus]
MKTALGLLITSLFFTIQGSTNTSINNTIVIAYGSSSFAYMAPKIERELQSNKILYVSDAIGGQIIETISAHQGSNPIRILFKDTYIKGNGKPNAVLIEQKYSIGSLNAKGVFPVRLSNGMSGVLDLDKKNFTTTDLFKNRYISKKYLNVDFGFKKYRNNIHVFNIGKNNITMGDYTSEQVFSGIVHMINYIENIGNYKYIVCGYYIDRGMSTEKKLIILEINRKLRNKYGRRYFDFQDYLMSSQIWKDINIKPTLVDIQYQNKYELAPSLSRDAKHLSPKVDAVLATILKKKLIKLNYIH